MQNSLYSISHNDENIKDSIISKFRQQGVGVLTNKELLSLILFTANVSPESKINKLTTQLLYDLKLSQCDVDYLSDILKTEDIDQSLVTIILACFQLSRRLFFQQKNLSQIPVLCIKIF